MKRATAIPPYPDLLVVSYFVPPFAEAQAIQVGNLLGAQEGRMLLACGRPTPAQSDPGSRLAPRHRQSRVLAIPFQPHPLALKLETRARNARVPLAGRSPDLFHSWRRPALRAIRQALAELAWRPRVLLTFGQPWTDHLIGLRLQRELGLPWLAHFSDPWADSPFAPRDPLTATYIRRTEARVVRAAQRVLFTSPESRDLAMSRYPPPHCHKGGVVTHSFQPRDYPAEGFQAGDRRVIRYLGTFYSKRDPSLLAQPLRILQATRPELLKGLRLEIIGGYHAPPGQAPPFAGLPDGLVVFRDYVPHDQSLALMAQAEALLVIEFPVPRSEWLPSKIIEYIGARRPILGMVPPGASRRVIESVGGSTADPSDPQAVAAMLARHLSQPPLPSPWGDARARREYEVARQAGLLLEEMRAVLEG